MVIGHNNAMGCKDHKSAIMNSRIDHFAFNVSNEDFELAKAHFERMGIEFKAQDHYYFHSLYVRDPDGHTVELTTAVKSASVHK